MPVTLTRKPLTVCGKSTRTSAMWRTSSATTSPSGACSARSRRHAPPLSYTAPNCHASGTRIGLMDSTMPVEAMVFEMTYPR